MTSGLPVTPASCQRSDAFLPILLSKVYEKLRATYPDDKKIYVTYAQLHMVTPLFTEMLVRVMGVNPHIPLPNERIYPCILRVVKEMAVPGLLRESENNPGRFYFQEDSSDFYPKLVDWLQLHQKNLGASELAAAEYAGESIAYAYVRNISRLEDVMKALGIAMDKQPIPAKRGSTTRHLART